MPNQWKPTSPLDIIQPHILHLWKACQTDKQIVAELQNHFNTLCYGLGLTKFLKVRKGMGLQRACQQLHTVKTIREAMTDLCLTYPNAGACEVVWSQPPYWHQAILSDPGSKNFGIANAHTMLCQWHDPALQGTLQHRWMQNKKNMMPEIMIRVPSGPWSQSPKNFGALDFKITVEHEALDHICNLYINPSHVVFDLVPQSFGKLIQCCYEELGCPLVTRQSAWDVYLHLLNMLQVNEEIPSVIEDVEKDIPLLGDQQDLPYCEECNGTYYMGGVSGGLGLGTLSAYGYVEHTEELISAGDKHLHQLENLVHDDEPETTTSIDEDIVGLDHNGLVIWEFSDDLDGDADVVDECSQSIAQTLMLYLAIIGRTKAMGNTENRQGPEMLLLGFWLCMYEVEPSDCGFTSDSFYYPMIEAYEAADTEGEKEQSDWALIGVFGDVAGGSSLSGRLNGTLLHKSHWGSCCASGLTTELESVYILVDDHITLRPVFDLWLHDFTYGTPELMQVQQECFENDIGNKLPTSRTTVRAFLMFNATFRVRDTGF
ncbi:hypothetical protein EDB19DRAFT_1834964 [Suillus lakei]|nr:hypothetical protein EDB19DRAFT_1834964 [Suillus lakei]